MAEFTYNDRCMIDAESILWGVEVLLGTISNCGAFAAEVKQLRADALKLAKEVSDYNDQFEVSGK